jgi:oligopeptide transport system substrate-binding protein
MLNAPTRRTKRYALGVALGALALVSLAACGNGGTQADPRVLNIGNGAEPLSLDPHKASGTWENNIIGNMFMGLTTEDANAKPIPGMAESWTTSADGLTWTFKIRDANWSDGVPVTADDFVFSFRRILDPKTVAQYATLLYPIKGAAAANTGKAPVDSIGVRAIDAKTLEIKLENPAPFLPGLLTHYTSFPVPKHVVEKVGEAWIRPENIVVNGPFILKDWRSNDFVSTAKNDKFYDAANVCLTAINYYPTTDNIAAERQVRSGKLDINTDFSGQRLEFLKKEIPDYVRTHVYNGLTYFVFNNTKPPFDNADVRQALSMSIDRGFITKEILRGGQEPAYSLVPPGISNYEGGPAKEWKDQTMEARRAEAKKLLEAAGYGPSNPLKFTFTHRNTGDNPRIAPVVQEGWKQIAPWVEVELAGTEAQIHYDNLRAGAFQVGDAGWIADYDDAKNFVFLYESRSGAMNYGKYSNPQFDALVQKSDQEPDGAKRAAFLRQAEELVLKEAAFAPVYFLINKSLVSPRVTGWVDNATDIHRARYLCTKEAAAQSGNKPS